MKLNYYADAQSMNLAGSALDDIVFRANSLFDPDFSGTGHQPRGFNQMEALFSRYCVIGSKITVKINSADPFTGTSIMFGVCQRVTSTQVTLTGAMEGRWNVWKQSSTTGGYPTTLVNRFSARKWFASRHLLSNEQAIAAVGGGPSNEVYFHVWGQNVSGTVITGLHQIAVLIEYIAVFFDPITPPLSN